ncbi:hypothetical protein X762_19980 [Mesorhizobium sp. LSHC426A00]|nr:hypothetical protein X770_23330 [Mesorhizobium sp. LSJC269B00]ESX09606.1 hypothetical protein X768_18165 [Mesorhizobium sp. LSJC265A00]ESX20560.1 hypothetical protein X767_21285 [Mesorhizobium sp. LSJC264A00]ESX46869.1 hypothetical protein X762_19980 [Mesorhizobium sp. LSHC426A00]ESX59235.1 hypothetical protein X761_00315 [Mesorhizobium sp. LSHC424B00]ESX72311.1 hypothetical protein X758_12775 [Mesorhizobium sp. LSHC416B00]ESX83625.1 hypothetical protein X756_29800 [Mesorhizobium sp. LSHC4
MGLLTCSRMIIALVLTTQTIGCHCMIDSYSLSF